MCKFFSPSSFRYKIHADNLRNIVEPRNPPPYFQAPQTKPDAVFPSFESKNTLQPSRKPAHIRRIYAADSRQNDLPSVKMTRKTRSPMFHSSRASFFQPGNRKMTKQDLVNGRYSQKSHKKHAFAKISFPPFPGICPAGSNRKCRQCEETGLLR